MAIRVIEKVKIDCDSCGKDLAKLHMSKQLLQCWLEEERFISVRCLECFEKYEKELKA